MSHFSRTTKGLIAVAVALSALLPATGVSAASATLYLSPASASVGKGSILSVSVRENSGGDTVQGVQANLTYPADLLSFVSISSSSAFNIDAQSSGGGGSVQIGRGSLGVSGVQTVATVRFKALTNSGRATISFAGGSTVASNGSDITSGTSGGTYTLTDPPPAAPAPAEQPKDTTPPKISDIKVSEIGVNTAAISWTTSEPASSEVSYGLSKNYGWTAVDANLVTAHKVSLSSSFLTAGHDYHYLVKSVDGAGNSASANDAVLTTQGAKALVTVLTTSKKAAKGAKVAILDSSAVTDKNGKATVTGLATGKQTLVVTYQGRTTTKTITVADPDAKNSPQPFSITVKPGFNWWIVIFILALLGIALWFWRSRGGKFPGRFEHIFTHKVKPIVTATPPPVVVKPSNKDA